jgi:hypothetical protein
MKSLGAKLVKILQEVQTVGKSGWNDHQRYHYTTEEDVLNAVKKALIDNKVFITESSRITDTKELINDKGKKSLVTYVETSHTFIDAESGETHTVTSCGQGHDSLDKGVFKAITGSTKYFFMKNFMVSTNDDPEKDAPTTNAKPTGNPVVNKPKTNNGPKPSTPTTTKPAASGNGGFGKKPTENTTAAKSFPAKAEAANKSTTGFGGHKPTITAPAEATPPPVEEPEF